MRDHYIIQKYIRLFSVYHPQAKLENFYLNFQLNLDYLFRSETRLVEACASNQEITSNSQKSP